MSRRGFLHAAEAAAVGATLGGCTHQDPHPFATHKPPVPGTKGWYHGQEKSIASVCSQCAAGCGIEVRVVEGRAVKIEGNAGHPINRGTIGPKGQSGLQLLYHPDRIHGPMRRDGERGSGRWKPVKWDEAIAEIAKTLGAMRAAGEPQSLAVLDGEPRGLMPELWDRFLKAYGSPNHVNHRAATDGGKVLAMRYMQGVNDLPAYDWERTRYVLGLGTNLLESWCQTMHLMRASSTLRHGLPGRRVKFVHVSPRLSPSSGKADEWVPIVPGTYGALALGLAHVLQRDGLHDEPFLRERTFGFDDWTDAVGKKHRGFRDLIAKDFPPDKVSGITGVPAATIERLAHELFEFDPAIAVADGSAAAATNGIGTAMAIHALNAMLGNLERPGGMMVQRRPPLKEWADVQADEVAKAGAGASRMDGVGGPDCALGGGYIQGLPAAILAGKPYPLKALFLYRSNPVFAKPDGPKWREALQHVPLVVSFSPLPDESTFWADFVLPDHTYLERWEVVEPAPGVGQPVLGLRQPTVAPLHDTMQTGDVIVRLAQAMGPSMAGAFPWKGYREAAEERLTGLLKAEKSSVVADDVSALTDGMKDKGGWWKAEEEYEDWAHAFQTPSGKFEFYSQGIAARLKTAFPEPGALDKALAERGVVTRGDDLCLPHWEPARFAGDAGEFPFMLIPYRSVNYAEGGARHLPWLASLPIKPGNPWQEAIEINPVDAERLGLDAGDHAWVESTAGRRRLPVRIHLGTRPGTAGLPLGQGPWPPRAADAETAGGYGLLANISDPLAGILAVHGTRVRIRKA